jgi:Fe-S-cluster-containing hydrogenase component 2
LKFDDFASGVLTREMAKAAAPPAELWESKRGGLVIIECPQPIPCDPCHTSCPTGAVLSFEDINDLPKVDFAKCTGCAMCVAKCPGLACFVVDLTYGGDDEALMKLPYEMLPRPEEGMEVDCLNRVGDIVTKGMVIRVQEPQRDRTLVVHVAVPKDLILDIRAIEVKPHG